MEQLMNKLFQEKKRKKEDNLNLLLNRVNYINEIERACFNFNQLDLLDGIRYSLPEFYNKKKPIFTDDDIGIVIQGPVVGESNFTWRIAKLYKKIYPQAKIVISSWVGESKKLRIGKNPGIDVIESNPPVADKMHVMHQMRSSCNGIKFLKQRYGVRYVLKTRADQVFYKLDFIKYLKNLLTIHRPYNDKLKERIIFCGHTSYFFPFFMGDFMTFSDVDVMLALYDGEYVPSELYDDMLERKKSTFGKLYFAVCGENGLSYDIEGSSLQRWQKLCQRIFQYKGKPRWFGAENYLPMEFYRKYIGELQYDNLLIQYWDFLAKYCIVMCKDEMQLYWPKYKNELICKMNLVTYNQIDYAKWLNLCINNAK